MNAPADKLDMDAPRPTFYEPSQDAGAILSEGPATDLLDGATSPTSTASTTSVVVSTLPAEAISAAVIPPPLGRSNTGADASIVNVAADAPPETRSEAQVPAWFPAACAERARRRSQPSTALFYARQDNLLDAYSRASAATMSSEHATDVAAVSESNARRLRIAAHVVNFCFAANAVLLGSNIFVAAWSGSLAVVASAIDCALDLISSGIIFFTARKQAKPEPYAYPAGKARLEPLSIVVFASLMGMAALDLIVESVRTLLADARGGEAGPQIDGVAIAVLCAAIAVKVLLAALCCRLRGISDSIVALAQEYRNDVVMNGEATLR